MAANTAVLFTVTALTFCLALFVYFKNPSRWVNRTFTMFTLATVGWTVGLSMGISFVESNSGLVWWRAAFGMAAFMAYALVLFFHVFPQASSLPRSTVVITLGIVAAILAMISMTRWIVVSLKMTGEGLQVGYGPLYPAFASYILVCVGYTLSIVVGKIRVAHGVERLQLKYLFAGLLVPGLLVTVTNLLVPLAFGTSRLSQYGPLFSLAMIAMIAHAIIRHRLMDIRVVIRKSVVYVVAFILAGGLLTALIVGSNLVFPGHRGRLEREILLSLLVAVLFHPLKSRIQRAFDRYLYRGSYDYQRTLRDASRVMTTMLDLGSLLSYAGNVIGETVRPESVSIYLRDRQGADYRRTLTRSFGENGAAREPENITEDSALPALLCRDRTNLLRDDLRRGDLDAGTRTALEELVTLGSDLALPLLKEDQLIGFVLVGAKRSGDPYFSEDLDLLSTLASQAAIAVTNAQLYAEVLLVNEYVENILKTMESGVIAADIAGRVTLFNAAAERMTGRAAGDLRSGPVGELPGALGDLLLATLADGVPRLQVERTLAGREGRAMPVVCSTSSFSDAHGRVLGAVLVFSDLTRLKELEGEKRRAERLASFEALASGIAHEIKNPLVAIKAFAQLLPKKFAEEQFRDDFARVAVREIARIDDLVDRLRVLASPSRALHPLNLREPIEETLELLRPQLDDKRLTVTRLYDEPLPAVLGDPAQLTQLFLNLFLNAIQAMEPDGALTIRLKSSEGRTPATVLAEVADTGCGIPEALREKVFDPFFSTKPQGTGLGLAICRGIADAHRATIRAEASPTGGGTTISLAFPAVAAISAEVQT